MLVDILPDAVKADQSQAAAKKARRELTAEEAALVLKVQTIANEIVQVDAFDKLGSEKYEGEGYVRPALRGTKFVKTTTPATPITSTTATTPTTSPTTTSATATTITTPVTTTSPAAAAAAEVKQRVAVTQKG